MLSHLNLSNSELTKLASFVILLATVCGSHNHSLERKSTTVLNREECERLPEYTSDLREEIRSKAATVAKIIDLVMNGSEKHSTYEELALFCDIHGPRMSGSPALDRAFEYLMDKMIESKLDDVHMEKAMIPKWKLGEQWAEITQPAEHPMSILALGQSVGTNRTIEAPVVVVSSFEQLKVLGDEGKIKDKIVVFNYKYESYGADVKYRAFGASKAAKYGALAALVRSVTPFSIQSPHTGMSNDQTIPTAAITVEDADLIQRWDDRGRRVVIRLFIQAQNYPAVESGNVVGDITGSTKPEEIVLISGHVDSWYNTPGAMDDGGGMMISYKALDILRKLNLRARRTIRAVLWTSEEFGYVGAQKYFNFHKQELSNFKVVMESDEGTFKPLGLSYVNLSKLGQCMLSDILQLTKSINTTLVDDQYEGSDIEVFTSKGIPGLSLRNQNDRYFYFHHSAGDTMTVEDPDDLDKSVALWAAASYVLADLKETIS